MVQFSARWRVRLWATPVEDPVCDVAACSCGQAHAFGGWCVVMNERVDVRDDGLVVGVVRVSGKACVNAGNVDAVKTADKEESFASLRGKLPQTTRATSSNASCTTTRTYLRWRWRSLASDRRSNTRTTRPGMVRRNGASTATSSPPAAWRSAASAQNDTNHGGAHDPGEVPRRNRRRP